jgi:hypothetical protein
MNGISFRIIGIAGSQTQVDDVLDVAATHPGARFALMLRDPEHGLDGVERLLARARIHARANGRIEPVPLIANAHDLPEAGFRHYTSAQLHALTAAPVQPAGASAHDLDEALRAEGLGFRYITLSPIFPTPSKPGHPGIGIERLREVCARASLPVFALGGIDADNARRCIDAGAWGIASISLFDRAARGRLGDVIALLEHP